MRDTFLLCAVLALAAFSVFTQSGTVAQAPEKADWSHVQAVPLHSGNTVGFFDTSRGKLYVYGSVSAVGDPKLLRTLQLDELGQPLKDLTPPQRPQ